MVGSYKIITRLSAENASFKASSRLLSKFEFAIDKPVIFTPGRARLSTIPSPTGSLWIAKTIGVLVWVASNARTGCNNHVEVSLRELDR